MFFPILKRKNIADCRNLIQITYHHIFTLQKEIIIKLINKKMKIQISYTSKHRKYQ